MSLSENRPESQLTIRFNLPVGVDPGDLRFSIYDGWENILPEWNKRAMESDSSPVLSLPNGLYTVRWEYADILEEKVVRLPQQKEVEIFVVLQTPAPVPGAADTHEYYSAYNGTIARDEKTGVPLGDPGKLHSRLHLLIRPHNREAYHGEDVAAGLTLMDENLKPIYAVRDQAHLDNWGGSLLCSLPAASGRYFLKYDGEPATSTSAEKLPRLFPLHLFIGWQTRLFLFYEAGQPNFASASLSLIRLDYQDLNVFERQERFSDDAAVEIALNGLQSNVLELPKKIERALLVGKFENPLLGLLGAHYLLNHPDASKSKPDLESSWRNTAEMVLFNLNNLLSESPDVAALRFKAAARFAGDARFPMPVQPVGTVPLLRASVEALLEADGETVVAIEESSLLEGLAPNLYFDTPWATFRDVNEHDTHYDEPPGWASEDWLANSIQDALKYSTIQKGKGTDPDWNHLSTSLGVPYRKMMRVVQEVKTQQTQIGGTGHVQAENVRASHSQVGGSGNTQINAWDVNSNNINVGDIIGNQGVAVGSNIRQNINITQGTSSDEIAKAFSTLLEAVQAKPDGPEKTMAQTAVQGLQEEAAKDKQADESNVQKWISFLGTMAPDIWKVAVDTFTNPVKGLSTVFEKVAERAKQEKGK
jgi:hypothetical protein